jgi:DNA-binding transcriptional LysR family regulator
MKLTFRQLRQIQALARHGNFRLAAEELHISQPALSRGLQTVERSLGSPLFDRLRGGIEPTQLGRLVLEKGETILRETNALDKEIAALLGLQTGTLRVASGPYPGDRLVPTAIARLSAKHPDIFCSLREIVWSEGIELLLQGEADVVFADYDGIEQDPRFDIEPMLNDRFFYICRPGHPLDGSRVRSLEDVARYPIASNRAPPRFGAFFSEGPAGRYSEDGEVFFPKVEAPTLAGTRLLLQESDAISLAPLSVIYRDIDRGDLVIVNTPPVPAFMRSGLVTLRGRTQSPATEAFREELRKLLAQENLEVSKLAEKLGIKGWRE